MASSRRPSAILNRAEVAVISGDHRIQLNGIANGRKSLVVMPHLMSQHAKEVVRVSVVRIASEDLPIKCLGELKLALPVVLQGQGEYFRNRCHLHSGLKKGDGHLFLEHLNLGGDSIEDVAPVAGRRLANEAHCRIPRAIVTVQQPPPIRYQRQRHPHRHSESAGEMWDGRVRGYHQIEVRHDGRGVHKWPRFFIQSFAQIIDRKSLCHGPQLGCASTFLQADKLHAFHIRQRRENRQAEWSVDDRRDWRRCLARRCRLSNP